MKQLKDFDLTKEAKAIFGDDVVEEAYATYTDYEDNFGIRKYEAGERQSLFTTSGMEPMDCLPIVVKFKNGKIFEIWSSEWGGVQAINNESEIQACF